MGITHDLDAFTLHPARWRLPSAWADDHTLGAFGSARQLVDALRRRDDVHVDDVVHALLAQQASPQTASALILTAWMPAMIKRASACVDVVDELTAELAISVGEYRIALPCDAVGLRYRIINRAWSRVRRRVAQDYACVPLDPTDWLPSWPADRSDPCEDVLDRMVLASARGALVRAGEEHSALVRAWNSTAEIAAIDPVERTEAQRNRLKYSAKVLRERGGAVWAA